MVVVAAAVTAVGVAIVAGARELRRSRRVASTRVPYGETATGGQATRRCPSRSRAVAKPASSSDAAHV